METALGAAYWLLGKVLTKLSDDLVAAFVASSELGHNFNTIRRQLLYTQGLLHAAQGRDLSTNPDPGLQGLLEELSIKADEAEDMLDEVQYFMTQDKLDRTNEATVQEPAAPHMGDVISSHTRDGRHAVRHTVGKCVSFFSCSHTQHVDPVIDATVVTGSRKPHNATKSAIGNDGDGIVDKLSFDRVDMSNRIKSVIEEMSSICEPVSDLLKIANQSSTPASTVVTIKRPTTGSQAAHDKLYGRSAIFEQTINALTDGTYHTETLSVLPIVGPGGIGKTTFAQHVYNNKIIEGHFTVKVWLCVSTDFDVHKLTRQIHSYLPSAEKEEYNCTNETATLDQLQKSISEKLKSTRFLIVLDDIWKCNSQAEWENLLCPLTKGGSKGNMVLVTTRFPSISQMVQTTDPIQLSGLEANEFLAFFEACIFGHSKPDVHYANDLIDVAKDIARKLKGSPLAANTVGRLLRKNLSLEYWIGVLEKDEWQNIKNEDDIMPSLKISYDYLPFHLKKCFSYCSLFPEDRRFYNFEMIGFWIAMGIVDSNRKNERNYLEELVDNGFLMKKNDYLGRQYYVMHDLLHELSKDVSSQECVNIDRLSFSAGSIPQSIRHLSITIENVYGENFEEEIGKLKRRIDIRNLRTLMIFGLDNVRVANILKEIFVEIKGLRILFIAMCTQKSLPNSFSNLIHLKYLKISSPYGLDITLPITLSRLYNLKFLDLKDWCGSEKIPKYFSRLVNLCHFHSSKELHSNIPEVGKMECLEELKEFFVKKENIGFELKQLGLLRELAGELSVCNLETVRSKGEASDAKLKNKRNLKELSLVWGTEHMNVEDDVLEGLHPPDNLRVLVIINPGVANGPSWLYSDISMKMLESLHLEGVSWGTLPPFEQLPHLTELFLKNIAGMSVFGPEFYGVTQRSFMHLKKIVFEDMPKLVKWVGGPISRIFSTLESIKCIRCSLLCSFPLLEYSDQFTNLCTLDIGNCPELAQFPLLPHTSTLTYVRVKNDGSELLYDGMRLRIEGYTRDLAFHNMDKVEVMEISGVSHITLSDLQKLNSLRSIRFENSDSIFSVELDDSVVLSSVQCLGLERLCITGELFSKVLSCFPGLSELTINECKNIELLPEEDRGLWGLIMLQSFIGFNCGKLFSRWPMGEVDGGARPMKPFPTSLRELKISFEPSMQSMGLLSNLTSLTSLELKYCEKLKMDGFNPLITAHLKNLCIDTMYSDLEGISIAGDLLSEIARRKVMQAGSFPLEELWVDSISAVLTAPICSHLGATLHTLVFCYDQRMTAFTEEQEQALQFLTSLQHLEFRDCDNLQSLPQGLHGLSSLKGLLIYSCENIVSLPPKEDLPISLESLEVQFCSPEVTNQAEKLKGADPWFSVDILVRDW